MKKILSAILSVLLLLSGCKSTKGALNQAITLREKITNSNGCSFHTVIQADYGEKLYTFSADCVTDREGNLTFTVTSPDSISGITGKVRATGGEVLFDDKVLAFQSMADDQITPVSAPWVFMKALRSGYIASCSSDGEETEISIDDSYAEDSLRLQMRLKEKKPVLSEIYWQGRRVLTLTIENFTFL